MAESSIIPPRVPFLDPRSGLMSREWYLFFLGIARLVTPDGSNTSIQDLAMAPTLESGIARYDEAIVAIEGLQASPSVPDAMLFDFDPTAYCAPTTQAANLNGGVVGILPLANGGTGASLTASNGGMVYSTASAMAILGGTATAGQIVRSGASAAPTWSTATYPATAGTAANVLRSDGTNFLSAALAAADLSNGTTGSGAVVLATSAVLTTPNLGTPSALVGTNITGTAAGLSIGGNAATASAVAVGGITGLGTGVATALAVNVGSAGAFVTFNGAGGTPSSMTATNLTGTAAGLTAGTASAVAVGGITGLGSGVATFLATPSSANLAAAVTDETGSGALVFGTSPTITTPTIAAINLPTPSTWNLGEPIEMGIVGSGMWSVSATDFRMTNNLYYNSGFKFAGTGYASYYDQTAGTHIFANSTASGTAGNAATMQDLLTIATTGALTIKTPPAFAAGDKYLVIDASGNIHVSALGPAS